MSKKLKPNPRINRGMFSKGDERASKAAANNQSKYRDEVTQTLISILNEEVAHPTENARERKKKLYVMLDRLVALGLGIEFRVGTKKFQFAPDLKAINVILDRLIGKPKQTMEMKPEGGSLIIQFGEDDDNETE